MKNNKLVLIIVGALVIILGIFLFNKFSSDSSTNSTNNSSITGTLDINGVIPDGASLVLSQTESGSGASADFSVINNPQDQGSWSFNEAEAGKTYTIKGTLKSSDGAELTESEPITVTSPATNQTITINLVGEGLTGESEISGTININGYFPENSTVSLLAKTPNTDFEVVREGMPAQASTPASTNKAVAGQEYQIIGYLYDANGNKIGESETLNVVAPAHNEDLTINSSATEESEGPQSKITGSIQLNGVAPSNSRIVILQAPMNSNDFTVAQDNIPAVNGQAWVWTGAKSGTWYNLQAVLKQRQDNGTDVDVAVSQQKTVAAPAINVMFTLDTGIAPSPTPSPTPTP